MSNFRPIDRQTGFLLPPSVDEWLPEKHLARFVVEVIDGLDLRVMRGSYRGSGSASYPPSLLLGILVYGYATGVFSSRKLERASYDSVAFRFIAANQHPDHDTIAAFRRRFLQEIEGLFVQVPACCTEEEEAREPPSPSVNYATRTEFGRPRSSIRLRTWAAMATSVARASSLWKRSPSPMTCFQRANWPLTRALSL